MSQHIEVYNLESAHSAPACVYVGISPAEAVISAYAAARGDWQTWNYEKKYRHLLIEGQNTISCGQFCAHK